MISGFAGKWTCLLTVLCLLGSLVGPPPVKADNLGRTLGGAAGLAAGSMAGAGLASAIVGAAGVAAMAPLAQLLVTTSVVAACAWGGSRVFSRLGIELDRAMGPKAVWTMLGATLGTVAAIALIPATGPFAGAVGLVAKGLIGGAAGGALFSLFSRQLESIATPRGIYAAAGTAVGAMAGGIPGALIGAAGGYAVGSVLDDHFFADEDVYLGDYARRGRRWFRGRRDRFVDRRDDITDWYYDRRDRFEERWRDHRDYYDDCEDSFYWYNNFGDEEYSARDDRRYLRKEMRRVVNEEENTGGDLFELKRQWRRAMQEFEDINSDPCSSAGQRDRALSRVRRAEREYQKALRAARDY